jgi:YD repeat-containing protein
MAWVHKEQFRSLVWALVVFFSLFSTPHVELILSCAAGGLHDLIQPDLYAEETDDAEPVRGATVEPGGLPAPEAATSPAFLGASPKNDTGNQGPQGIVPVTEVSQFFGAAVVKIPIEAPPGRLGIAPDISFTYNSYLGNGWIGVGWNIDMGSIRRSTRKTLNYGANDYVATINGSSSDLVPRSDWGANYYGPRVDSALSKYFFNTSTGGWEVTSRDGTKYYYGSTTASRQDFDNGASVFKWCLDKVLDVHGNYMTVTYSRDQGEIYLARIDYTGNTNGLSPTHSVRFYIEDRTDASLAFTSYRSVRTAKRLKTIEVTENGHLLRAYRLSYLTSIGTQRSLVSRMEHFGNDATLDATGTITGGTALPETAFTWPEATPGWTQGTSIGALGVNQGYFDSDTYPMVIGDFNGDGKTDVGRVTGGGITIYLSTGTGWAPMDSIANLARAQGYADSFAYPIFTGDFTGDGKTDVGRVGTAAISAYTATPYSTDLLGAVTSSAGATTSITYTPSSAYRNTLLPFILHPVSSITTGDGRGGSQVAQYFYEGGLFDYPEREFRGFRKVTSYAMHNSQSYETRTVTWFRQDLTRKGTIEAQLSTSYDGHARQVNYEVTAASLSGGATWPRLDRVTTAIIDAGAAPYTTVIEYDYDSYLNITGEHKYGMEPEDEVHTYSAYTGSNDRWIIGKPTDVTVTTTSGNIVSRKWMDYDSIGNLLTEEVCRSDTPASGCFYRNGQNPIVRYSYSPEGNVSSVADPAGYVTTFAYDATGTYVVETVNPLGHKTTKEYDPGTGKVLKFFSPYLQGTAFSFSFSYDVFGRIAEERRPDGGSTT